MSPVLVALCMVLVIGLLIGRDQAEFKISHMRTRLLALGSQRQRLVESQREIRVLLTAAEERLDELAAAKTTINREVYEIIEQVKELHLDVTGEELEVEGLNG